MVGLGLRLLARAWQGEEQPGSRAARRERSVARSWFRGLATNLLNPKIGAFYVAVLPQFIPPHAPHLAVGVLLAFVHACEGIVWFSALILGAHTVRAWFARRGVRRAIDALTGATLIGFGAALGLSSR